MDTFLGIFVGVIIGAVGAGWYAESAENRAALREACGTVLSAYDIRVGQPEDKPLIKDVLGL